LSSGPSYDGSQWQEQIGEGEVLEALDGAFEQMLLEQEGESIDDLEARVMRLQYLAGRAAMARHLTAIAQKKLTQQASMEAVSSSMKRPIGLMAR
jgi:hypothetical protein